MQATRRQHAKLRTHAALQELNKYGILASLCRNADLFLCWGIPVSQTKSVQGHPWPAQVSSCEAWPPDITAVHDAVSPAVSGRGDCDSQYGTPAHLQEEW